MTTPAPPPGWYPDPAGAPTQRYFDGTSWTDQRAPLPAPPGYGGPPGYPAAPGHGFPPPPRNTPGTAKVLAVIAGVVLAAVAALAAVLFASGRTHTEATPRPGRSPMPSSSLAAAPGAPRPSPPGGSSDPESRYLMLLRSKPDLTITDPDRLLDLGREVCVYLGTQTGSPIDIVGNVRQLLLAEGVSSNDGQKIAFAAIATLCPQHKSKVLPR